MMQMESQNEEIHRLENLTNYIDQINHYKMLSDSKFTARFILSLCTITIAILLFDLELVYLKNLTEPKKFAIFSIVLIIINTIILCVYFWMELKNFDIYSKKNKKAQDMFNKIKIDNLDDYNFINETQKETYLEETEILTLKIETHERTEKNSKIKIYLYFLYPIFIGIITTIMSFYMAIK